jgi:hypothetical protein
MLFTWEDCTFTSWKGKLEVATPGVPESATLNLEIPAPSMTTGSDIKNKMVKGRDFLLCPGLPDNHVRFH